MKNKVLVWNKRKNSRNLNQIAILTLTATPIPRTLQSSIFKIKDISLIQTPPVNRVNIKTFLMIEDLNQIKRVIEKEIQRGGQIFYVSPRISDLENIKKKFYPPH